MDTLDGCPCRKTDPAGDQWHNGTTASEAPCTAAQVSRLRKRACRVADIEALIAR